MRNYLSTLTPGDVAQLLGAIVGLGMMLAAYLKLRPEKRKLAAEEQLSGSQAAALVIDKAMALLDETEERLRGEIDRLELSRDNLKTALDECRALCDEMEVKLEDTQKALALARQQSGMLNSHVKRLMAQLRENEIEPKLPDY